MDCIRRITEIVRRWEGLGSRSFPDGTLIVGHQPYRGPQAYLHRIFGPLTSKEIEDLTQRIGREIPSELRSFYTQANGVQLFEASLNVYGVQRSLDRTDFDAMHCLPFDLWQLCVLNRPHNMNFADVIFSTYVEDRSLVFIEWQSQKVCRCPADDASVILNVWPSLSDWLVSETERISALFDGDGRALIDWEDMVPTPNVT